MTPMLVTGLVIIVIAILVLFLLSWVASKSNEDLICCIVFCFLYRHDDWQDYFSILNKPRPITVRHHRFVEMKERKQILPQQVYFVEDDCCETWHAFYIGERQTNLRVDNQECIQLYFDVRSYFGL